MVKITQIKLQKNKKRVNLYLDGKFAFPLDADNFLKARLKIGQELSEKEIEDLIFKNEFQKLLDKTVRFISYRPRSKKEVKDYLKKKLLKQKTIVPSIKRILVEKILKRLKELRILNDEEFARWLVEQRSIFRPRGKLALRMELAQKGVDRELAEKVIDLMVNEIVLAEKAARKKMKTYQKLGNQEFRKKMTAFLSRRGFSWETIRKVIDDLNQSS